MPATKSPRRDLQLALVGPPQEVLVGDTADDTPPEPVDPHLDAAVGATYDQLDLFLDAFPESERAAAAFGGYRDADGVLRTTHRMLSVV